MRNATPIELHLVKGNPNRLTKKEIEERQKNEIHLGGAGFTCPGFVRSDPVAYKKWKECVAIYRTFIFVTSADSGHLARYCKTFSEYIDLLNRRENCAAAEPFSWKEEKAALDELEEFTNERGAKKLWAKIEYMISTDGIIAIDKAINQKMGQLTAMEDRLFLNPLSKIKNVAGKKEQKKVEEPLAQAGFGNV
jgi:phage terminase small subunit